MVRQTGTDDNRSRCLISWTHILWIPPCWSSADFSVVLHMNDIKTTNEIGSVWSSMICTLTDWTNFNIDCCYEMSGTKTWNKINISCDILRPLEIMSNGVHTVCEQRSNRSGFEVQFLFSAHLIERHVFENAATLRSSHYVAGLHLINDSFRLSRRPLERRLWIRSSRNDSCQVWLDHAFSTKSWKFKKRHDSLTDRGTPANCSPWAFSSGELNIEILYK